MANDALPRNERTDLRGQRRKKGLLVKAAIGTLALLLLLPVIALLLVKGFVTEEYLVETIEESINSEVEIGEVDLAVFSYPTRITLSDVKFSAKDGGEASGRVKVTQLDLDVSFWQLLRKHIDVSKITVKRAEIISTYYEDGTTSLGEMFRSPKKEKKRKNGKEASDDESGFNVFDEEDFVASLGGLVIEDSRADITLEKTGLRIRCDDVQLELKSIKVDPKNLKDTNTAQLFLSGMVKLHSTKGWHYGDINLSGETKAKIFNPETGEIEPNIEGRIDLKDDSWLNTRVPFITKAWKTLDVLEKVGIKVVSLPERATFGRSQAVDVHYHQGKVTVREPLSIWVGDWELAALDGSWLQTETDQHEIQAELLASVKASEKFVTIIGGVVKLLSEEVAAGAVRKVKEKMFRDDRLVVKVKSTEELSDPKIRVVEGVPDVVNEAKKAGKDVLKSKAGELLKGILE